MKKAPSNHDSGLVAEKGVCCECSHYEDCPRMKGIYYCYNIGVGLKEDARIHRSASSGNETTENHRQSDYKQYLTI